jgi:lipopolysaccharide transport system ATP-binding protein
MEDIIEVKNLSKKYLIGRQKGAVSYGTLRDELTDVIKKPFQWAKGNVKARDYIWALEDVNFSLKRGEILGLIGPNGAGKSTLLKILTRITPPSGGEAIIKGRVSSLLEVGTGFHPELTGRENIYLNGAILGMSKKEIEKKFDEIADFAEVRKFLDTPAKHYSTGMYMRLAFSVAAHLEPDILLVDEVLAVGDDAFQKKSLGKMDEITKKHGRTIVFVSHNMGAIKRLCSKAILLNHGKIVKSGNTDEVVDFYLNSTMLEKSRQAVFDESPLKSCQILRISISSPGKTNADSLDISDEIAIEVSFRVRQDMKGSMIMLSVYREGTLIFNSFDTDLDKKTFELRKAGDYVSKIVLPKHLFAAGRYSVSVGSGWPYLGAIDSHPEAVTFEIEELSEDTSHQSYAKHRGGLLIMPLDWNTKNL